jgi:peroxiredoxin
MNRLFAIALLLALAGAPAARAGNDLAIGAPAPPITLTTLDGRHIDTRDLRGKVVILTFWATWCAPCRDELPQLSLYAQQHARDGLVVLAFSLDTPDKLDEVRAIAKGLSFPVGLLVDPHVPGYGRIWHLPVNFTIDRDGDLADNGWKDKEPMWTQERLDHVVTPLLKAPH